MSAWEIARDQKEADWLYREGYGYKSKAAAEKALADPEIDSFYRSKLKIFKVSSPDQAPESPVTGSAAPGRGGVPAKRNHVPPQDAGARYPAAASNLQPDASRECAAPVRAGQGGSVANRTSRDAGKQDDGATTP